MSQTTNINQSDLFGHPKGLYVLFMTELWERFSFYGMKALLIFYLVKYHLFSDEAGNLIVGSYAAMVYAMPVIGGYLADKFLGFKKAVIFGGVLLVLGHLGMAYEGNAATAMANGDIQRDETALSVFFLSLSLIVLGVRYCHGRKLVQSRMVKTENADITVSPIPAAAIRVWRRPGSIAEKMAAMSDIAARITPSHSYRFVSVAIHLARQSLSVARTLAPARKTKGR